MRSMHQTPRGDGGGGGGGGGGGMSRAAKRRAKKKKIGQPESTGERHQSMAKSGDRLNEPHTKKRKVSASTSAIKVPAGLKNSEDIASSPKNIQLLDILLLRPTDALDEHVQHDIQDLTSHERAGRLFGTFPIVGIIAVCIISAKASWNVFDMFFRNNHLPDHSERVF